MLSEQIMKSSPFSRIIVSVSTVIALTVVAYNWAVSPQTTYLYASHQYTEMNDTVQKKVLAMRKTVAIKKKKLREAREETNGLKAAFFTPSQSREFFSSIQTMAKNSGCNIELMTFKADRYKLTERSKINNVRFFQRCASVKFVGRYAQITRFLKNITDRPGHMSLSKLNISSSKGARKLICEMDIIIYICEKKELIPDENNRI